MTVDTGPNSLTDSGRFRAEVLERLNEALAELRAAKATIAENHKHLQSVTEDVKTIRRMNEQAKQERESRWAAVRRGVMQVVRGWGWVENERRADSE